ncbi:MAG: hypothetical protein ABIJ53_01370 [Verrucomicrobiota bacterium]
MPNRTCCRLTCVFAQNPTVPDRTLRQSMFALAQNPAAPTASSISTQKAERKNALRRKDKGGRIMSVVGSGSLTLQFRQ